jgi:hypothetical protein
MMKLIDYEVKLTGPATIDRLIITISNLDSVLSFFLSFLLTFFHTLPKHGMLSVAKLSIRSSS